MSRGATRLGMGDIGKEGFSSSLGANEGEGTGGDCRDHAKGPLSISSLERVVLLTGYL